MSEKTKLLKDRHNNAIQGFVPDPNKAVNTQAISGTTTVGTDLGVDIEFILALLFRVDADITYYFNSNTSATRTIPANTDFILLLHDDVTEITLTGAATLELEVM